MQKFLEPNRKLKVIYTDNSSDHNTTQTRTQKGLLREQYVELRKGHLWHCCNQVWVKSGGRIPCYCYLRNIQDLLSDGKTPYERRFWENYLTDQFSPFGAMVEYHIYLVLKSCQVHMFLGYVLYAGGIRKGNIMVADIEDLAQMDASELHARRLNAKEVSTPMKGEKLILPVADGTVKISGEDQDLRTSTLIRDNPDSGEEPDNLREESEGSSSTSRQDSSWYDGEAKGDFWSISGDFIHRHHVEPRVRLYVPTEGSFSIPGWICMVGRRLTRKQTTSKARQIMARKCGFICLVHRNAKQSKN